MQRRNFLRSLVQLSLCAVMAFGFAGLAQAQAKKVDGAWTWTMQGRNGGQERKMTLNLKVDGEKVTGKLTSPGRDGATNETEITNGKIKGDEISFTVVREYNGNKMTSKYSGKVTDGTIKGKIEFDRNGETQSRDWEAKRPADKK